MNAKNVTILVAAYGSAKYAAKVEGFEGCGLIVKPSREALRKALDFVFGRNGYIVTDTLLSDAI